MKREDGIRWLHAQLPGLVEEGVLSEGAADDLRRHYGPAGGKSGIPLALLFLGVFGALLIGSGIILLFAHNWEAMTRSTRAIVSFLPLAVAQTLSAWVLWKRRDETTWVESAGIFHVLSVGASIALVAQTYHMPGSFDSFLLIWMLLTIPMVYLLRAVTPLLVYFAGITAWAGYQQSTGDHTLLFWALAAAAVPFVWSTIRAAPFGPRSALVQWGGILAMTCALGIVLEKGFPGLWIPVYAAYFATLYLAGGLVDGRERSFWLQPARRFGGAGAIILVFLLTWSWPWEEIGWHHTRLGSRYDPLASWLDGAILLALLVTAVALLATTIRRRRAGDLVIGSLAPLMLVVYAIAAGGTPGFATLLMNIFLLTLSGALVVQGVREVRLRAFNGGMVIFSALVVARFFDSEISFIAKGIVFIALGVAFLVCNIVLARRKENAS